MKIATKLTKRVAEFVNDRGIGVDRFYDKCLDSFFHYPVLTNGSGHLRMHIHDKYKEVPEQEFIDLVTAELDYKDNKFKIGDTVIVNDDYLERYGLMNYSGIPVKIIDPTIKTQIDKCNVDIPNNLLGGLNVPKHKLKLAGKTDKLEAFNPQTHYDNSKGSLYKIATERNWNAYTFDVVKRLDRGGKKDPLRQEIEKSIDVLKIWLNELEN